MLHSWKQAVMVTNAQSAETELLAFMHGRGQRLINVTADTDLLESGLLDSLLLIDLILHVEETYGVQFGSDDVDPANFRTVAAMVNLLLKRSLPPARVDLGSA
jgi:acyl carrier protein